MNAPSTTTTGFNLGLVSRRYAWLALIPFVVLLIVGAVWGIGEWQAAQDNRRQLSQWEAVGIPFNNATMQNWYDRRTHPEGAADWIQIIELINWGVGAESYKRLPYQGSEGKPPLELVPGGGAESWPDSDLVASYLEEIEPVIDLIEKAAQHPKPVRFPMKFQGINTQLEHIQQSRSILRLLSLDCDYAYFKRDTYRALRDINRMKSTAAAFDSRECLVSELIQIALQGIRTTAIRRTLTNCLWSETELTQFRESLALEENLAAKWKEIVYGEMAFGLSALNDSPEELSAALGRPATFGPVWPSEVNWMIKYYDAAADFLEDSPGQWKHNAAAWERKVNSEIPQGSVASLIIPAFQQIIESEIRAEVDRRWTLTAVALRQYKQQLGKWPQQLQDLKAIGLSQDDYSNLEFELFGYVVENETAYLWTENPLRRETDSRISPTRPIPKRGEAPLEYLLKLN